MKTENQLTGDLVRAGRECKALVLNLHGHREQAPGWPDVYISHVYWTGWIEFKGKGTLLQGHQRNILMQLRSKGVQAWIVRFLEQENTFWKLKVEDYNRRNLGLITLDDTTQKVFVALMKHLKELGK